jgi:hypothetical protein
MEQVRPACSIDARVCDCGTAVFFLPDLCGRRCHRNRHLVDRAIELVAALFVVFAHRRAKVLADILGFIRWYSLDLPLGLTGEHREILQVVEMIDQLDLGLIPIRALVLCRRNYIRM